MIYRFLRNRWNRLIGIRRNVKAPADLRIGPSCYVIAPDMLEIGRNVSIGGYCWIGCNGRIGNGVLMSSYVGIAGRRDHDMRQIGDYISLSRWIFDNREESRQPAHCVVINDDVWIGLGALILSGVTIGRGAIIGAGSVVTMDVPAYTIVAGNPARQTGRRFNDEQIREHEFLLQQRYGTSRVPR